MPTGLGIGIGIGLGGRAGPAGPAADPVLYFIPVIGQSNATGIAAAGAPVSTSPLAGAYMFNGGVRPGGNAAQFASLTPLVESSTFFSTSTTGGETICYGLATRLIALTGGLKTFVFAVAAITATAYAAMARGTATYNQVLAWAQALVDSLAATLGKTSVRVLCLPCLHGEQDQQNGNTSYDANLATWQSNYNTDLKAITGQSQDIPFFACQQSHYPPGQVAVAASSANNLYKAGKANPTKIIPIGNRQLYPAQQTDGSTIHISNYAERWHGGRYGNAIYRRMFLGDGWLPVQPIAGQVNFDTGVGGAPSATIVANFTVPTPPLVLDFSQVTKNGNANQLYGFSYFDDTSPPAVTGVAVSGPSQLTITLSGVPTGTAASRALRAGWGSGSGFQGPFRGNAKINVRDSEPSLGIAGAPLHNWCCHFQEAVT